jgi:Gas vesicle protein
VADRELAPLSGTDPSIYQRAGAPPAHTGPSSLADILERVLDKGIVIAGDIQINLLEIELLTIKLRLLIASVDRAREMGINWWESDASLSSEAKQLEEENESLRERLERLEEKVGLPAGGDGGTEAGEKAPAGRARKKE